MNAYPYGDVSAMNPSKQAPGAHEEDSDAHANMRRPKHDVRYCRDSYNQDWFSRLMFKYS